MKYFILLIIFFNSSISRAQKNEIDIIIKNLDYEIDTVEAAFLWVVNNIEYDINSKNEILKNKKEGITKKGNKERHNLKLLKNVLETRKGVCQEYSLLLDELFKGLGYKSFVISGYTRNRNGEVDNVGGHAWNAVYSGSKWKLFDPTWAAGKVGSVFHKEYDPKWNNTDPKEMIKSHMPFDPIWQLLSKPISYNEFEQLSFDSTTSSTMNYNKLIEIHLYNSLSDQSKESLDRSNKMTAENQLIKNWRARLEKNIGKFSNLGFEQQLNSISQSLDEKNSEIDEYFEAKKNNFNSEKWTPKYSQTFFFEIIHSCKMYTKFFNENIDKNPSLTILANEVLDKVNKIKNEMNVEYQDIMIRAIKN